MQCPICPSTPLVMAERQGIEIDYCPKCRGVWLDRGELDKLIERAAGETARPDWRATAPQPTPPAPQAHQYDAHRQGYRNDHSAFGQKRRKGSLLGELFDFD